MCSSLIQYLKMLALVSSGSSYLSNQKKYDAALVSVHANDFDIPTPSISWVSASGFSYPCVMPAENP